MSPADSPNAIDVMIPLGPRDHETLAASVRSVRAFVEGVRTIYLVAREDPRIPGAQFVPESLFPFGIETIAEILGTRERAGWYLQQLIKLYFPSTQPGCLERVLAVDADTVFLRPCRFVDATGRPVFNFGDDHHPPYFAHMARMHPSLQRLFAYSGITHCMLFDRRWLAELMQAVETHHGGAQPFWRIFLDAVDPKHKGESGASEYETYFNFCLARHPEEIVVRRFVWRNIERIDDIRLGYDYVSLHWHSRAEAVDANGLLAKLRLPT